MDKFFSEEKSDSRYEVWTEYRNSLTEYVMNSIESYLTNQILCRRKALKLNNISGLDNLISEYYGNENYKPTLAIWGAGGLNDLDAKKLSNYFRLVLIDDNIEATQNAVKKYSLPDDTLCMDLEFWKIDIKSYEMLEATMQDKIAIEVVAGYIEEIVRKIEEPIDIMDFDFSIVAGLASQLNARFWKVVSEYEGYDLISKIISKANYKSSKRLYETVKKHTKETSIWSCELRCLSSYSSEEHELFVEDISEKSLEHFCILPTSEVEGNNQLFKILNEKIEAGLISPKMLDCLCWPFSEDRVYQMLCFNL